MNISMISPGVVPPAHYGGTERVVNWLIRELTSQGHTIYFFGPHGSSVPLAERVFYYDSPVKNINIYPLDIRERIPEDTDIVHLHSASNLDYGFPVLKTVHGYPFHFHDKDYGQRDQFDEHYSFVSNAHRKVCGRPDNPYVYNGIRLEDYHYSEDKDDYFLFMGKLDWEVKGLSYAVKIAQDMNVKLIIAGDFLIPENYARMPRGRLFNNIEYIGPVSGNAKAVLIAKARALISPIMWPEPFGLVVIEALASGTPVLTTREGAMPEIMKHGVTGFLCETMDDMKEKIGLIDTIVPGKCRDHIKKNFTSRHMTMKYISLYSTVIKKYHERSENRAYSLS